MSWDYGISTGWDRRRVNRLKGGKMIKVFSVGCILLGIYLLMLMVVCLVLHSSEINEFVWQKDSMFLATFRLGMVMSGAMVWAALGIWLAMFGGWHLTYE